MLDVQASQLKTAALPNSSFSLPAARKLAAVSVKREGFMRRRIIDAFEAEKKKGPSVNMLGHSMPRDDAAKVRAILIAFAITAFGVWLFSPSDSVPLRPAPISLPETNEQNNIVAIDHSTEAFLLGEKVERSDRETAAGHYLKVKPGSSHYDDAVKKLRAFKPATVKKAARQNEIDEIFRQVEDFKVQKRYGDALYSLSQIKPKEGKMFELAKMQKGMIRNLQEREAHETAEANARKLDETSVRNTCRDAIRDQANYKSKADFSIWNEAITQKGSKTTMAGHVELMNGFGAMIPHLFLCEFKGSTLSKADILQE